MKKISSRRAKALQISDKVRFDVWKRDGHKCVVCDKYCGIEFANSHLVKRSQGGKGIVENIFTHCFECHQIYDHGYGEELEYVKRKTREYADSLYPNFTDEMRIYRKD